MNKLNLLTASLLSIVILLGCSKEEVADSEPPPPNPYTKIIIEFSHNVDGADLISDTIQYVNRTGNVYSVVNLKYLVGSIRLKNWDDTEPVMINEYHLVDLSDPATFIFQPKDTIKIYDYQTVSLFMGFDEKNNITSKYPELNNLGWGWPLEYNGGYYTLRMLGGYWSSISAPTTIGYDMAIGGNIRKETQSDTTYIPNPIYATLQGDGGFSIPKGTKLVRIKIGMDINKLFMDKLLNGNYDLDVHQTNLEEDAVGSAILSKNLANCFKLISVSLDAEAEIQ